MLKAAARGYWLEGCNIVLLKGKEPLHKWSQWQTERQSEIDFEALPWAEADGFAIICGQQLHSGLFVGVIDFDVKNISEAAKEKGRQVLKALKITQIEQTPSGGEHWIYHCHVKPKTVSAYHNECGLELLGEGKICIMAPSVGYRKLNDNTPTVVEDLETLFYQALEKAGIKVEKPSQAWFGQPDLAKQPYKGKAPPCINALLKGVEEGIRNESAIRLASYFLNFKRLPWARTLEVLQSWNSKNRPPLPDSELKNILKSAEIHGYVYGCNDDVLKAFCDKAKCPFGLENLTPIEILKLEIAESENIIIHPLIDYNSKVGLTLGVPLSKHAFPGASNQFLVFMAEKPFILPKKPPENEADFPTHVQLKQARWLAVSPTYKKESLLVSLEAFEKGKIEFPPKNEVFEKTVGGISKYWGHRDTRYYTLVACWAIATWFYPIFQHFPILNPQGQRKTGKTTLLEVLRQICWNPTPRECALREAGLFRTIQDSRPTYIIDITKLDGKNRNYIDVIDVCESGTERGGVVKRVNKETGEPLTFQVYSPKAIATRTELPFVEKAIRIITEEDTSKTRVRHQLEKDDVWPEIVGGLLRAALKYWPEVAQTYEALEPTEKLQGRFFDYWSPLLAVCKVFAPEKFQELLSLAEEYAATQAFEDMISEVENAVLSIMLEYEDETLTITLKDLTLKVKELVPWLNSWHHVKSAVENLHIVRRKYSASKGLTYQLDVALAHEKARQRLKLDNENNGGGEGEEPVFKQCYVCLKPIWDDDWTSGPETEYKPTHKSCFAKFKQDAYLRGGEAAAQRSALQSQKRAKELKEAM